MNWVSIPRPRLCKLFRDHVPLTFIYGLAGSGKTQLLREWTQSQNVVAVWFTCSEADNDPFYFWQHLIHVFAPTINNASLTASPFPSNLEASVIALVTWIETQQHIIHLVIDDYHLIQSKDTQWILPYFLQRRPTNLRVAITSRLKDVPLPLKQWALSEQLTVVAPKDLAFTLGETRQAVYTSPYRYTEAEIQALHHYTNGWITGVKLTLLQKSKEFTRETVSLHDPQQLANHLCEAVFHTLPSEYRTFLLQTSILDVLTADVCHGITRNMQSQVLLETLADYGLLVSLDSDFPAFRYLDFWKDFLSKLPEERDELHRRAALWYRAANDIDRAISHALLSEEALAGDLIRQCGRVKIARGELTTLRCWIAGLPESRIRADGELSMMYAWALVHAGELDQTERYLHHPTHSQSEVNAVRARIAAFRGNKQDVALFSEKALQQLPETAFSLRADMLLNLGCAYLEGGQIAQAQRTLMEALQVSRTAQQTRAEVFATYFLGKVNVAQGRLQQAFIRYQEGLRTHGDVSVAGVLHVGIAEIYYEHNDLNSAKRHLEDALHSGEQGGEIKPLVYANIALGLMLPPQEAVQRLEYATSLTNWTLLYAWQALWWLRAGNTCMASYWLEDTRAHSAQLSEFERLTQARILLALEQWEDAAKLLDSLQANALEHQRYGDLIHILLLQAQRQKAQGKWNEALQCVAQAVERGEREEYVRTFLDEGESISQLCLQLASQLPENRYLQQLVRHFMQIALQPVPLPFGETLSQREVEVLYLIAEGASNEDIADKLFLTTGTVKWHVHNILGKLDAKNRTQAVKKAKELGLLTV
jgi:LuxR family maltose regulon positive regulatory protein